MKRILALFMVLCMVFSLCTFASADEQIQHNYSTTANSGIRHEVCTTLLGTNADAYYTGSYTYESLSALSGSTLLTTLRTLMTNTHKKTSSYNDCRDMAVLTDCENGDGTSVSLLYTSYSSSQADWISNNSAGWNREHVWPQSLGDFSTSGPGADLHHVRPSDNRVNSVRGNLKYGNVDGGTSVTGTSATQNALGGYKKGNYFEPLDNVKGDVARICLYMYVRYGGDSKYTCGSITKVFESVEVLLQWCELDPVDTWEMGRNEVVAKYQGNRNVFIDYPELAWLLFDEEIPSTMTTPSGEAASNSATTTEPTGCPHAETTVRNASNATCTENGYTGDTICADCGDLVTEGEVITTTGHDLVHHDAKAATCTESGWSAYDTCNNCDYTTYTEVPSTGHINANGDNLCDVCGTYVTCSHAMTYTRAAVDVTCTKNGYTGDTCCAYCQSIISYGTAIPATGHKDANEDRKCDVCNITMACSHSNTTSRGSADATCTTDGYTGDTYCSDCGELLVKGITLPATGHRDTDGNKKCDACNTAMGCSHTDRTLKNEKAVTCTTDGYTGDLYCSDCGEKLTTGESIPAIGHWDINTDKKCDICSIQMACSHTNVTLDSVATVTCTENGYTGDTRCTSCNEIVSRGKVIPATGHFNYDGDYSCDICQANVTCGHGITALRGVVEPSCTAEGYTGDIICIYCQTLITAGSATRPMGHAYSEWIVTREPTDRDHGEMECYCEICGEIQVETIPATGDETTSPDETLATETTPSETVPAETDPTETAPAETEPASTEPNQTDPAETDPTDTEPAQTQPENTDPAQTQPGDPAPAEPGFPWWIITVMVLCVAAVIVLVVIKKKKETTQPEE